MALRIFTDSSCDIDLSRQEELDLTILPLRVIFGDTCYVEGENLTRDQFYAMLEQAEELPKTAQYTPMEFEDLFRPLVEAGDEILVLPISKEMSGTYQAALLAREAFPDAPIYVVDTLNVTFALGLLVMEALALRDQGLDAAGIYDAVTALVPRVRLYAVIGDLKYLKMGGRLSSAGAVVGTLLGIKPLIAIEDGKVISIAKARGQKAGFQMIRERVEADGIDFSHIVAYGHSNARPMLEELMETMKGCADTERLFIGDIGPVVGTHAGPGCAGIAFIKK